MGASANVAVFVPHGGCPHRCAFCDQRRISGVRAIPGDDEVRRTLHRAAETLDERLPGAEIAFFGGSFTAIPRGEMLRLLEAARPFLGSGGFHGIRISTRPDAVDPEVLALLAEYGVTAIELGAQSMDDRVLSACGRGHSSARVGEAAGLIRAAGFSLGLQMMTGLPLDTDEGARRTARALAGLRPDTVRIYPTLVLEETELARLYRAGGYRPQQLEDAAALCGELLVFFTARGIRVIRLGLHDSPEVKSRCLAGPYHPAFREMAEGSVLLRSARRLLADVPPGRVTLEVAPGSTSKMVGQKRANLLALEKDGYRVSVVENPAVKYLDVVALPGEQGKTGDHTGRMS